MNSHAAGLFAVVGLAMLTGSAVAQVMQMGTAGDMTGFYGGRTRVQDLKPLPEHRGVGIDGTLRQPPAFPWHLAANDFDSSAGTSKIGDVWLQTGTYSTTDVDLSLPAPGFRWIVGRSYSNRQDDSGRYDSNGYQGRNWSQLSQPEIVLYDASGDSNDIVYLVYGADRFVEFKWSSNSVDTGGQRISEFRGINGAAGVIQLDTDKNNANSTPDTWTYYDSTGTKTVFFGFDSGGSGNARGQLWKVIDPAGNTAYVGDASTAATAISSGYDGSGRILLAFDSADRRYTYTYSTIDSVTRLTQVKAETKTGGAWASSPTGVVEVGKVDYSYYQTGSNAEGDNGTLRMVTLTTPLTDSGVNDVRKKLYHYYKSGEDYETSPGHAYSIKLVLGYEGARRFDWAGDSTLDDDFLAAETDDLKSFSTAYMEYENASTHRVSKAFFNGECGCSGGTNGLYQFGYDKAPDAPLTYLGYYWLYRTVVARPDATYLTQYFDMVAQPLSWVVTDSDPAGSPAKTWVTEVVRSSAGVVASVATPEANNTYDHSDGAIATKSAAGMIGVSNRVPSGDLASLLDANQVKDAGTGASADYVRSMKYLASNPTMTVGSYWLIRPMLEKSRQFKVADTTEGTAANYDETVTSYTFWSATATNPLVLRPKTVTITAPKVADTNNGPGTGGGDPTVVATSYIRRDGTTAFALKPAFSNASDSAKIYTYTEFTNGQLTKRIEDVATNGSFTSGDDPNTDFGITETGDGKNMVTTYTYDAQGRLDTATMPDGRVTKNYYSKLGDGRLVTISVPRMVGGGSTTYYGPATYSVTNQAGKNEFSGTLAITSSGITTGLTSWVTEATSDPISALHANLKPLANVNTSLYDSSGTRLEANRMYFVVPGSGDGSAGTNYDETTYGYDDMGHRWRIKSPAGDISRVAYDELGRVTGAYRGTNDRNFAGGESSGTDNMVKIEETTFDLNSRVTSRKQFIQDSSTGQRETTFMYDGRGRTIVQVNPQPPHSVMKYDNLGRVIATGLYSSSSGLSASTDPTLGGTSRVALTQTTYDEMGRAFKTVRHEVTQSGGSAGSLGSNYANSLIWFDSQGRAIKTRGEQLSKTFYNRLGRVTNQFTLAKVNESDTSYGDADDVSGDTVLEESQTYYQDSTGLPLMTVRIARHPNDTTTTGALDTDAVLSLVDVSEIEGRAQITSNFYDAWNRITASVSVGTHGDADFDRDGVDASTTPSSTNLVTFYSYDDDGNVRDVTDPRGKVARTLYDAAGRKVATIANYVNGTPSSANGDDDVYTRYEYTSGLMTAMWVDLDGDGVKDMDDQITTYIFGTTKGTPATSLVASGSLLRAVKYPDSGNAGTTNTNINSDDSEVVSYAYNALGQQVAMKDQAGNVIETVYDTAGRQTSRKVSTLITGFNGAVRRIDTAYLDRGLTDTVTQYDAASSGNVTDQVKYSYDGWGNLTNFDQDVDSVVGGGGRASFGVGYAYSAVNPTGGRATIRRTSMTIPGAFPSAVTVTNSFGSSGSINDTASRVAKLTQGGVDVAAYEYLGASRVVTTTLGTSIPLVSTVFDSSGTTYPSMDQFNRITSSRWTKVSDIYHVDLTYDENSNILRAEDLVHTWTSGRHLFDVEYTIDSLNRLTGAKEGNWNDGLVPAAIDNATRNELWSTLTQTGNWGRRKLDLNGDSDFTDANEMDDSSTFSVANEWLTRDLDTTPGTTGNNYTMTHDAVGNMTDDGKDYKYVYDAFGRMVTVKSQSNVTVAEYRYNGLGHRISWHYDADADTDVDGSDPTYYFCYDDRWRQIATYRGSDSQAKENFTFHNAGINGYGISSYIDSVVLRDSDRGAAAWTAASDGVLGDRIFYCQNWRADVSVIADNGGTPIEWIKYSAYGVPTSYALADFDRDGDIDVADINAYFAAVGGSGAGERDVDYDGEYGGADDDAFAASYDAASTGGRGVLSRSKTGNRIGYAGYQWDEAANVNHVRHRVYRPDLGRWTRRDPAGYTEGNSLLDYVDSQPVSNNDPYGLVAVTSAWAIAKDIPNRRIKPAPTPRERFSECMLGCGSPDSFGYADCVADCFARNITPTSTTDCGLLQPPPQQTNAQSAADCPKAFPSSNAGCRSCCSSKYHAYNEYLIRSQDYQACLCNLIVLDDRRQKCLDQNLPGFQVPAQQALNDYADCLRACPSQGVM